MKRMYGKKLIIVILFGAVLVGLASAVFSFRKCLQRHGHPGGQLVRKQETKNGRKEGKPWKT